MAGAHDVDGRQIAAVSGEVTKKLITVMATNVGSHERSIAQWKYD
jgi:hypothetical protein